MSAIKKFRNFTTFERRLRELEGLIGQVVIINIEDINTNSVNDNQVMYVDPITKQIVTTTNFYYDGSSIGIKTTPHSNYTLDVNGNTRITGETLIDGSLVVMGDLTTINTIEFDVSNNYININKGQEGIPPITLKSGIRVNRGDLPDYLFEFSEEHDLFRVGVSGNGMDPVTERELMFKDRTVPVWDGSGDFQGRLTYDDGFMLNEQGHLGINVTDINDISNDNLVIESSNPSIVLYSPDGNEPRIDFIRSDREFGADDNRTDWRIKSSVGDLIFQGVFEEIVKEVLILETFDSGQVGIGGINPSNTLDVNGNTLIKGTINIEDNILLNCNNIVDVSNIQFCDGTNYDSRQLQQESDISLNETKINYQSTTGLYNGGLISINFMDSTAIDINSGIGVIAADGQDTLLVEWNNITGLSIDNISTTAFTHIYLKRDGTVLQSKISPTPILRRDSIYLGKVVHDGGTIEIVFPNPEMVRDGLQNLYDYFDKISNFIVLSGGIISADGANLKIDKSSSTIFRPGINYVNDDRNPNVRDIPSSDKVSFTYRQLNGTISATTDINPNVYENPVSQSIISVSSNKFTNQRIFMFPSGVVAVQYGQQEYNKIDEALEAVSKNGFVLEENIEDNAVLLAILTVKQGTTQLNISDNAQFTQADQFGRINGGSSGSSTVITTLQASYDNDIDGIITLNGSKPFGIDNSSGEVILRVQDTGSLLINTDLDVSCNLINDVSGINFCDGTYIGQGNSFDISTNEILKIKNTNGLSMVLNNNGDFIFLDGSTSIDVPTDLNNTSGPIGNEKIQTHVLSSSGASAGFYCYDAKESNSARLEFYKNESGDVNANSDVSSNSTIGYVGFRGMIDNGYSLVSRILGNTSNSSATQLEGVIDFQTKELTAGLSTKMRIAGNGNVGIGTTDPSDILHIIKDQSSPTRINLENKDTNGFTTLRFTSDQGAAAAIYENASNQFTIQNAVNGGSLRFQTTDNVGSTSNAIFIDGSHNIILDGTTINETFIVNNSGGGTSQNTLEPKITSKGDMIIERTNTSGQSRRLVISGARNALNPTGQIEFWNYDDDNSSIDYRESLISSYNNGNEQGRLIFYTAETSNNLVAAVSISEEQNVGIGLGFSGSSPEVASERLEVNGNITATGDITAFSSSDYSLKKNIEPITDALNKICKIHGYTFEWKEKKKYRNEREAGVIAQEIQTILPEVVKHRVDNTLGVDYPKLTALLIEGIRELVEENKILNTNNKCLEKEILKVKTKQTEILETLKILKNNI